MTFDERKSQIQLAELIGRYLDEPLDREEKNRIHAEIERAEGGEDLLADLQRDRDLILEAVPADMPTESLHRLTSTIKEEFELRDRNQRQQAGQWTTALMRIAASLLLVAGTFAATSFWMQMRMDNAMSSLAAFMESERAVLAQSVQDALETRVSGEPVFVQQTDESWSETLTPITTYKSKSGHWCRQYLRQTIISGRELSIQGTACRDETGIWTTVIAEPVRDHGESSLSGV